MHSFWFKAIVHRVFTIKKIIKHDYWIRGEKKYLVPEVLWVALTNLVIVICSHHCVNAVRSELAGNIYAYVKISAEIQYTKHHHTPALGMKEVILHSDWQEHDIIIHEEKEFRTNEKTFLLLIKRHLFLLEIWWEASEWLVSWFFLIVEFEFPTLLESYLSRVPR